jgi:uncharacterized protein
MKHDGQLGIYFDSSNNHLIGTLFLADDDSPKPTALILHGVPGIEKSYDLALALRNKGWNSLIFHYRGCWGSTGNYVLKTIPEDVTNAVDYLCCVKHIQIDPKRLIFIGHSFGGWASVLAAVRDPRPKAVITLGAVTDPRKLNFSAEIAKEEFTPWLSGITPEEFEIQWNNLGLAYCPVEEVSKMSPRPILIIHGDKDAVVPVEQGKILYERASVPKDLIIIPEANHDFSWHRQELIGQILNWLDSIKI